MTFCTPIAKSHAGDVALKICGWGMSTTWYTARSSLSNNANTANTASSKERGGATKSTKRARPTNINRAYAFSPSLFVNKLNQNGWEIVGPLVSLETNTRPYLQNGNFIDVTYFALGDEISNVRLRLRGGVVVPTYSRRFPKRWRRVVRSAIRDAL